MDQPISKHRDPLAVQSERLDAMLEAFSAESRRATRRLALAAVLGAFCVVAFGIWGFRFETNTRTMHVRRLPIAQSAEPVVIVLNPLQHQSPVHGNEAGVP